VRLWRKVAADQRDATRGRGAGAAARAEYHTEVDYIYEQPPRQIFDRLVPRYVETEVYRALLESSAAEHAARMTAMDKASENANEMLKALKISYNRARQAAITTELSEIVSGAAALQG
jgi:F-type H+-transporting ATPase subunit gamma